MDFLAGKIIDADHRRCGGPGHQQLLDPGQQRICEINLLETSRGDRQVGNGNVPQTFCKARDQFITPNGNKDHMYFQGFGLELLVDKFFKLFEQIIGNAPLPAAIQKIKRFAVCHQHPDLPLCSHLVKVTDPWFILQHRFLWR